MNDFELESKLKSIPLPKRTEEYWEDFPAQVRVNLRRPPENFAAQNFRLPRLAWCGGFALVCLIFALALWPALQITLKNERAFRRELAQLPNHLRTFMADEHGMHYLIADQQ
jgi:hypothetical protein